MINSFDKITNINKEKKRSLYDFPPTSDEEDKIESQAFNLDGLAGIYTNVLQQCQCKRKLCKIVFLKYFNRPASYLFSQVLVIEKVVIVTSLFYNKEVSPHQVLHHQVRGWGV